MLWWEVIVRLLLAMAIGGAVGLQREYQRNAAGFRTHTLVSLGACMAMLTNEYLLRAYSGISNVDISRMGSYVISGIGFLGAGAILRDGLSIRGLTTAAGLWAVACLGIAAGAGFYLGAAAGTVLVVVVLSTLKVVEDKYMRKRNRAEITLQIKNLPGHLGRVLQALGQAGLSTRDIRMADSEKEWQDVVIITTLPPGVYVQDITQALSAVDDIKVIGVEQT